MTNLLNKDQDILSYHSEISKFIEWCDAHCLIVNVKKTEEMIFNPKSIGDHGPVYIHVPITQVSHSFWEGSDFMVSVAGS